MSPPASEEASSGRLPIMIPLVVAMAFLMEQLDSTIITTAVPAIARSLEVAPVQMSLAVAAYVLAVAVFIPVSGWLADRFGARRIFVSALVVFTAASALCGMAQNFSMLVATRILQGLGGAMMTPVGRLILLRSFPRRELMTAMTYVTLPAIIGPVIGPLLGGVLTTYLSWRWIFYVNLPFGLLGIVLALRFVGNTREPSAGRFDFPGFVMVGSGLGLLQFSLENVSRPLFSMPTIAATLLGAMSLLLAFGVYARHADAPVVDLGLFHLRSFRIGTLGGGICRVAMNGVPFLLPLMLQVGFGMSPIASGSITFVSSISSIFMRLLSSRLLPRYGFDRILIGSAIAGSAALAGFAILEPGMPHWALWLYVFVFGLTRSIQFMTSNTLSYADMPNERLSRATSLGGALQQLSVSFGVTLGAVLLSAVSFHDRLLTPARFHEVFLLTAVLPLLAIPLFRRLRPEDGAQVSGYRRIETRED